MEGTNMKMRLNLNDGENHKRSEQYQKDKETDRNHDIFSKNLKVMVDGDEYKRIHSTKTPRQFSSA